MTLPLRTRLARRPLAHATQLACFSVALATAGACQTEGTDFGNDADSGGAGSDSGTDPDADLGTDSGADLGTDSGTDLGGLDLGGENGQGAGSGAGGEGGGGPVCETASSETELLPVYLAVAFDVSGSMGALDRPHWWYDPTFKWVPVAEAMRAFFMDPAASGISASMTVFPGLVQAERCDVATYEDPDVAMTELPSMGFDAVLDAYEAEVGSPLAGGNWRGGTPTVAAVKGAGASLDELRAANPVAQFALILVTDGLPTDCPDGAFDETVDAIAALEADGVPTYVIGIQNPTEPPAELPDGWADWGVCAFGPGGGATPCEEENNLDALEQFAVAGGTEDAFLLDTDDPLATQEALTAALLAIAAESVSCEIPIPPHPNAGESFEPDNIDVVAGLDGDDVRLEYDETCEIPRSWHYDDEADPAFIELCPETCSEVQADPSGSLTVEFLCEPRVPVVK